MFDYIFSFAICFILGESRKQTTLLKSSMKVLNKQENAKI